MQTSNTRSKRLNAGVPLGLVLILDLLFCLATALAQGTPNGSFKHFQAPLEYFPAPHDLQIKTFLEGAEAEPQPDGLILIRDAKLQTFHEDGTRDMTVITPSCIFDAKQQTVNSAGPIQVQMSDDKLFHEGKGFLWRQTNNWDLIISNRVHTIVRGTLTNSFTP